MKCPKYHFRRWANEDMYILGNVHKERPTILDDFRHTYLPKPCPMFYILRLLPMSDFG